MEYVFDILLLHEEIYCLLYVRASSSLHWRCLRTHFYRPFACTRADVQYPAWIFQGRKEVPALEQHFQDFILQVQSLIFVL